MSMVCPKCGRSFPSEQTICPADGTDLVPAGAPASPYDVTHHSRPGVDTAGVALPLPPTRSGSAPDATISYSEGSSPGRGGGSRPGRAPTPGSGPGRMLTPSPSDRGMRDLSTPTGSAVGPIGRELSAPVAPIQDIQISPGDMVNEYQITGQLGEGGMGTVYEGVQPVIGKRVAIKVLLREYASNAEVVNRFIQEARAANQAQSRYIVDIFSFGELCDGRHYFVMEYLDGKSLRETLDERKIIPFDEAYAILSCMAKGLAAAHKVGIIHRDIKPENIVVLREADGSVSAKVLDFGIAKLQGSQANPSFVTKTGAALGTPYYMSPEQCRGQDVDHRTDIYALGIITFEMFAGALPYTAGSYIELVNKHLFASPPTPSELNPEISAQLEAFILRCIAKNPTERPQTMDQFRSELAELVPSLHKTHPGAAAHAPSALTPDTRGTAAQVQPQPGGGGKKVGLMLGILALLLLAGGGVGAYLWYQGRIPTGTSHTKGGGVKDGARGGDASAGLGAAADSGPKVPQVPVKRAALHVASEPGKATVYLDGKRQPGVTPLALQVEAGARKLRLELEGHEPLEETVEVVAGRENKRTFKLAAAKAKEPARVKIVTGNARAIVLLGDREVGRGAAVQLEAPAGTYTLEITAPKRRAVREEITLQPGQNQPLKFKLKRRVGGSKKPQQQTKPDPGTKTPGQKDDPDDTLDPFKRKRKKSR